MNINDLLICTFDGDTASPPHTYVAEITAIDTINKLLSCHLVDTGQQFSLEYATNTSGPWQGTDDAGVNYIINTHEVYTPGATDPIAQDVAVVTFSDNNRYLCFVDRVSPTTDIIFYHQPYYKLSIDIDHITKSDWDKHHVGEQILSIEGCVLNNDILPHGNNTTSGTVDKIIKIASSSPIVNHRWVDRGIAPIGYIKGMALSYARVYCKLKSGDAAANEMAKANTGDNNKDALAWYNQKFLDAGMVNNTDGVDTLRHLFVLLVGLGMRESSGKYCEGRDGSASNTTSDTAEAGLFQTSFNIRGSNSILPQLFLNYTNSTDFVEIFKEGVRCKDSDNKNFGTGDGKDYQRLSKACPAFAVEFTAVALRNRRKHWGPINRRNVEIRKECDAMLLEVQRAVDQFNLCALVQ